MARRQPVTGGSQKKGDSNTAEFTLDFAKIREDLEAVVNEVKAEVKKLLKEGRVRKVVIKKKDGTVLQTMTLNTGIFGVGAMTLFAPLFALVVLAASLALSLKENLIIEIQKEAA